MSPLPLDTMCCQHLAVHSSPSGSHGGLPLGEGPALYSILAGVMLTAQDVEGKLSQEGDARVS